MAHASELIATDIDAYLAEHRRKGLLRLLTCGSVDDGKSTLIGRLLHDSGLVFDDHLDALKVDSRVSGTTGDDPDLALLLDGLQAEREQGITIDVAYRYFSTRRRKFIIADTPGHVQYTRNMVTGASTAQLALILIDARHGVLDQTRRHATIAALLGIRHVVAVVNKMDLVGWSQQRFIEVAEAFTALADRLDIDEVVVIPVSALSGDQVVAASSRMAWFDGPTLLEHLETVDVAADADLQRLRFPVQLVVRPDAHFRGFAGTVASGTLRPGQPVLALPSNITTRIDRIVTFDGDVQGAVPGDAVTLTLTDEIDLSRGDLLVDAAHRPHHAHDLDATLVWMGEQPAAAGRQLLLRSVTATANATLVSISHRLDVTTLEQTDTDRLRLNDIARCIVTCDHKLLFDAYRDNATTGSFILIDRMTNVTVAAGMIHAPATGWDAEPAASLTHHRSQITSAQRRERLGQQPATVLLTGMTGVGKTTIARALERRLFDLGHVVLRLDGENLRLGISRDLGFTAADRSENLRRAAEIAVLAGRQGLITIIALQAPHTDARARARALIGDERFVEVHLHAPERLRRQRDLHGLYDAADRSEIDLPGITETYQDPTQAELNLDTSTIDVTDAVEQIVELLRARGVLSGRP